MGYIGVPVHVRDGSRESNDFWYTSCFIARVVVLVVTADDVLEATIKLVKKSLWWSYDNNLDIHQLPHISYSLGQDIVTLRGHSCPAILKFADLSYFFTFFILDFSPLLPQWLPGLDPVNCAGYLVCSRRWIMQVSFALVKCFVYHLSVTMP